MKEYEEGERGIPALGFDRGDCTVRLSSGSRLAYLYASSSRPSGTTP